MIVKSFMTEDGGVLERDSFTDKTAVHCNSTPELSTGFKQDVGAEKQLYGFQSRSVQQNDSWIGAGRESTAPGTHFNDVQSATDSVTVLEGRQNGLYLDQSLTQNPAHSGKDLFFPVLGMDVDSFNTMSPLSSPVLNPSSKFPRGKAVTVNGKKIALFCVNDQFYAIDEQCPHLGGPLHLGDIEDMAGVESPRVVCPWHKWCFELATGRHLRPSWRHADIQSYPVITNSLGQIFIGFSSFDPSCFNSVPDF